MLQQATKRKKNQYQSYHFNDANDTFSSRLIIYVGFQINCIASSSWVSIYKSQYFFLLGVRMYVFVFKYIILCAQYIHIVFSRKSIRIVAWFYHCCARFVILCVCVSEMWCCKRAKMTHKKANEMETYLYISSLKTCKFADEEKV